MIDVTLGSTHHLHPVLLNHFLIDSSFSSDADGSFLVKVQLLESSDSGVSYVFRLFSYEVTLNDAEALCQSANSRLASFRSQEETDALRDALNASMSEAAQGGFNFPKSDFHPWIGTHGCTIIIIHYIHKPIHYIMIELAADCSVVLDN